MQSVKNFIMFFLFLFSTNILVGQEIDNSKVQILELTKKSERFLNDANFKESLFYAREALKLSISLDDDYFKSVSYKIIASNYEELSEYDKSITNYKIALQYAEKINNQDLLSRINNNIGNIYFFHKKEYEKALELYDKSILYGKRLQDTSRVAFAHLNLTWAKFDIGHFSDGLKHLEYINKNIKYLKEDAIPVVFMLNGMYNSYKGNAETAKSDFEKSISEATRLKQDVDLSFAYLEYSMFLDKYGMYKNAFDNLDKYRILRSKIYDEQKLKRAVAEGLNFEIDEYKRAIAQINQENAAQAYKLKKSRITVYLFIAGIIALLFILYTLYKNNLYKKKLNAELATANIEMKVAKDMAIAAAKVKTQFVSTISHELRTPLYGVVGLADMIIEECKGSASTTNLNSLKFSAKYLLSLINDILQISKMEENKLVLETYCFNLAEHLQIIKDSLVFVANFNNNKIIIDVANDIPTTLIGDKIRLCQILINLISNALKFTSNDNVILTVRKEKMEGTICFLKFEVIDHGIGIAKKDQESIFEKFVQIERKNEDYQGTGLGLSIVKKLVNLFGSEIYVESEENQGSTFTFTIPFDTDVTKCIELNDAQQETMFNNKALHILVVEDNKINQIVTRKILTDKKHSCTIAESGLVALELLKEDKFDIILMDINMPGMDGFATSREIRKRGYQVPIIALTAYGRSEIIDKVLDVGMNDCLVKPFEAITLFTIIGKLAK